MEVGDWVGLCVGGGVGGWLERVIGWGGVGGQGGKLGYRCRRSRLRTCISALAVLRALNGATDVCFGAGRGLPVGHTHTDSACHCLARAD